VQRSRAAEATPARRCAYRVVRRVFEQGAYADVTFRVEADREPVGGREHAFAMQLAYGTIQRRATLDYLIERLSSRSVADLDAGVLAALRLGLYQIVYLDGVPDHASVSESVELAKDGGAGHRLVNAVLRRAVREASPIVNGLGDATPAEAALRHSHPRWIVELWWEMLGREQALALLERDNEPAESAVRTNVLRATAAELVSTLAAEGIRSHQDALVPEAVVLDQGYDIHGSELFERGLVSPQSRGSMLVAHALAASAGDSVLDLCAAPGAKTTHLAELMGDEGRIVALDLDARRAQAITANCERLGIQSVEVRVGDARSPEHGSGYDRVLVDPPCSDLGTLQSRPDLRWRKTPEQVAELRVLQSEILDAAAEAVRRGGRLVYSTCTIDPAENERQIEEFLGRHRDFSPIDLPGPYAQRLSPGRPGLIQTLPHRDQTDGFFIAALVRSA
jgi:16S rRNA (cytosine967-C5)-methyltransferase